MILLTSFAKTWSPAAASHWHAVRKPIVKLRSGLSLLYFPQGFHFRRKAPVPVIWRVCFVCPSCTPQSGMRRRDILKNPLLNLTSGTQTQKQRGSVKILCAQRHSDFFLFKPIQLVELKMLIFLAYFLFYPQTI